MDLADFKFPEYSASAEVIAYWQNRAKSGDERAEQFLDLFRRIFAIGKSPIRDWPDVT
jgi:hypothetical protein